ncbi:MAG: sulfur relay protein DsrC [Hyphomicrobiaceae bacterium]|nr:sulfur relay protein DsrC [Hyphomicrobiaceae bacterium]
MADNLEREPGMVNLSDLIIYNPEVQTFQGLLRVVAIAARDGARFLIYDVKPDYADTPKKWQPQVERVFSLGARFLGERA